MANPQPQHPASHTEAKSQGKRGLRAYLPWILVLALAPVAGWVTLRIISSGAKKESAPPSQSADERPKADHETAKKPKLVSQPEILTAPLTHVSIGFHRKKYLGRLAVMDVNGDALRAAEPDTIRVNVAGTRGGQILVASLAVVSNVLVDPKGAIEDGELYAKRLSVQGDHRDFLSRLNTSKTQLLDIASSTLGRKTIEELGRPGAQDAIRSQLLNEFTQVLGSGTLQDVTFLQFEMRAR